MLEFLDRFTATDLNKAGGRVLDRASAGPVEVSRRDQSFTVIETKALEQMLADARAGRPMSLEDMLADYDPDKVRSLTKGWREDAPAGKERI